ncbi:MAG: IS30 family transposase [Desulfobulbaceae bacterium]|nr:IS30 family transposase [Desulfobulbaceae bacterium]
MRHYKHLTQEQRYQISSLLQTGISQSEISRIVGVSKSTISRELNRNTGKRGYRPKQAHHFAIDRKANNSQSITDFGWAYVEALLAKKFSPEQITGRLRYLGWQGVPSHERIYQYIYADKKAGGKLYKHLRCQKTYRKRGTANHDRRGQLVERVDITQRPLIADNRQRLGDYEGDTVIGKGHKGVLVTLVDRATREAKIRALPNRKADKVAAACIDILAPEKPQSITFDNGKEFAQHQAMATALKTEIYFAKPYHSWERGTNENTNGLIRQFLPKSLALDNLSEECIQAIEDNLNNRPRKVLGYQTPLEVKSRFGCVALRC